MLHALIASLIFSPRGYSWVLG